MMLRCKLRSPPLVRQAYLARLHTIQLAQRCGSSRMMVPRTLWSLRLWVDLTPSMSHPGRKDVHPGDALIRCPTGLQEQISLPGLSPCDAHQVRQAPQSKQVCQAFLRGLCLHTPLSERCLSAGVPLKMMGA